MSYMKDKMIKKMNAEKRASEKEFLARVLSLLQNSACLSDAVEEIQPEIEDRMARL